MEEKSGAEFTLKPDVSTETEEELTPNENSNEFSELIELILELSPEKYASPFSPIELLKMREIIVAGRNKFPKRVIPYIELMRKFLFANFQLIAMAALAHQTASKKSQEKESLVKPATFSDLGRIEAERSRNGN